MVEIISVVGLGTNIVRNAKRHENGGVVLGFDTGMVATITFSDATPTPWGFEAGTGESPYIPKTNQSSMFIACTNGGLEFPTLKLWSGDFKIGTKNQLWSIKTFPKRFLWLGNLSIFLTL